jgi:hypothetical protein
MHVGDRTSNERITCETQGHLWGRGGVCIMCKTPKPERPYAAHDAIRLVMSLPNPDDVVRRYVADALLGEIDRLHAELLALHQQRAAPEPAAVPANVQRYKVQQDKGIYALKGCPDGDLVDWSAYEALLQRAAQPPGREHASGGMNQENAPAGIYWSYLDKYSTEHVRDVSEFLVKLMCDYADRGDQLGEARAAMFGTAVDFLSQWAMLQPSPTKIAECQHDLQKPNPTVQFLGSAMNPNSSDWIARCTVCNSRWDHPMWTASSQGE